MEGRIKLAFESSNDKNHDEDLLHTITLLAQHMAKPILDFFQ
jgi:hypothetical protein